MALSWLKSPRAAFASTCVRIRDWFLAPLREHICHFENRQIDRYITLHKRLDDLRELATDLQHDYAQSIEGLVELLHQINAQQQDQDNYNDINLKLANVQAGLFGGHAQEWMKKMARAPKNFTYE